MALQGFMDFAGLGPQVETLQPPKQTNLTLQKTSDSSFSQLLSSLKKDESPSSEKSSKESEVKEESEDFCNVRFVCFGGCRVST